MFHSFFSAICRVGIFMICAQALLHFRAQETYEKYLKMLVSIMILLQLFLPVGVFVMGGSGEEAAETLKQLQREMAESVRAAEENAAAADAILEQMTLEEVQNRMEAQQAEKGELEQENTKEQQEKGGENLSQETGSESSVESGDAGESENISVAPIEPVSVEKVSVSGENGEKQQYDN